MQSPKKENKNQIDILTPDDSHSIGMVDSNDQQRLMDWANLKRQVQSINMK